MVVSMEAGQSGFEWLMVIGMVSSKLIWLGMNSGLLGEGCAYLPQVCGPWSLRVGYLAASEVSPRLGVIQKNRQPRGILRGPPSHSLPRRWPGAGGTLI